MAGNRLRNKKSPLAVARFGGLNQKINLKIPENDDFYKRNPQTSADLKKEDTYMDVVITINEQDLMKNPGILDMVKGFAERLAEPTAEGQKSNPTVQETEPQKETPVAQTPKEVAESVAESTVSIEEVRTALAKVSKKHGAEAAKAILRKHGAENLSGLDATFYAAVLEEAKEVL
jgi:hypothetical protein